MHKILNPKQGEKIILLGNEAIARGALEAGVGVSTGYPGTPASEIGDTFAAVAKDAGIYFEYSLNEKVATEVAAGAAFSGVNSLVSYKHFGLNVAADSVFPLSYYGVKGGMVIVFADDPQCWSSGQSEQDSRRFARIAHMPLLEPSDAQECKDFTKIAFEISKKFKIPVMIRLTTRVCHASGVVELGKIVKGETKGRFTKENKWRTMPPKIIEVHKELHEKYREIRKYAEKSKLNFILKQDAKSKIGIITNGVSYNYVVEALDELGLEIPVLKLGLPYPRPIQKVGDFIKNLEKILVVEELEAIIEREISDVAKHINPKLIIQGKDLLPKYGEFRPEIVTGAIGRFIGKKDSGLDEHEKLFKSLDIPERHPVLCPGCPHRASFYAAKKVAGGDAIFAGDIGCYIMGIYPPQEQQDFIISMGASEGISHGIKKVSDQKVISFIGDGTFFHAGIPGLINCVYNKSNPLIFVLDNRYIAMTGHQPNPGTGYTGMGEKAKELRVEEIAKACGVENIKIVNPYNQKQIQEAVKEFLNKDKVSMIVSKQECRLAFMRRMKKQGTQVPVYEIDEEKCTRCGICLYEFGCPAIHREGLKGKFFIDKDFCWGCSVCAQVCPANAIRIHKGEK